MSGKEQFDRSKCFTFFESYYTTGQMIEEMKGKDVAYKYYKAIIEYETQVYYKRRYVESCKAVTSN